MPGPFCGSAVTTHHGLSNVTKHCLPLCPEQFDLPWVRLTEEEMSLPSLHV